MVNYPTSLDTDGTLYNVTDNVDYVLAVHHNALKDAVIALETALGITGAFNFTTDAEFSTHESNPTDINHLTDAQMGALHTAITTLTHTALTGKNDETNIKHLTDAQLGALHAVVTTLTHTSLSGKNSETDIKHLTDAQQTALHAAVVAGDLNHNDLANIDAGEVKHITSAQLSALHTIVVAGDLNHNDLANINAGDVYEHISATQLAALHTIYALTNDLASTEITAIQNINTVTITNAQWGYVGELTASVKTHMDAANPHSGSGTMSDLVDDETPTLFESAKLDMNSGYLDMNNGYISLNNTVVADGKCTGIIVDMRNGSGATRSFGDFVYIKAADEGYGSFGLCDANAVATMPCIGMVVASVASGQTGKVLLHGIVHDTGWNWTVSATGMDNVLYISETVGVLTVTAPTTVNAIVQAVGVAIHQDKIIFNPSFTTVKVAA